MKQVLYNQFSSDVTVLEVVTDAVKPEAKTTDEVVVRIQAVSINPLDWKVRRGDMKLMTGSKLPKYVGYDFAGIIDSIVVGNNSTTDHYKVGDAIFGAVGLSDGALAEYIVISTTKLYKKPPSWTFVQAASVPIVGSAAYTAIDMIRTYFPNHNTKDNDDPPLEVLLYGATGGLGMFAIQIAKDWKMNVTAVCSTTGIPYAAKWGANEVIDYKTNNVLDTLTKGKYDAIVDLSGKFPYTTAQPYLEDVAIYIDPSPTPGSIIKTFVTNLITKQQNKPLMSSVTNDNMSYFISKAESFDIEINKTFTIDQVQDAYRYAEQGGIIGKVVIEI